MTILTPVQVARLQEIIAEQHRAAFASARIVPIGVRENPEVRITSAQLRMMQNCTGHARDGHRNHYVSPGEGTVQDHAWNELVDLGLAEKSHTRCAFSVYCCTDAGYRFLYGASRTNPSDQGISS